MGKLTVILKLPKRNVGKSIPYARHIAALMGGNPLFPSPPVAIATLLAHVDELEQAQTLARTRALGAAEARDAKLEVVENDLKQLRAYVQTVAAAHGEQALAVVASSGMSVKGWKQGGKLPFAAKQGKRSGSVRLDARHPGGAASFFWQGSTDGERWVDAGSSNDAHFEVDGLTAGARHWFRFRMLTGNVMSDWSDPLTLLVV